MHLGDSDEFVKGRVFVGPADILSARFAQGTPAPDGMAEKGTWRYPQHLFRCGLTGREDRCALRHPCGFLVGPLAEFDPPYLA